MHIDARTLDNDTLIEGDICIVGAGAAGISAAIQWLKTGKKVILLEGGGFNYEDRTQEVIAGTTTGQPYYPLKSTRLHYFGGSTGHWGGMCSMFDPIAFSTRDWVNMSGWPITQQDLWPYYLRSHEIFDLGEEAFDVNTWEKKDPVLKRLPLDKDVFWNKIWRYSKPTRFGEKYRDTIVKAPNIFLYTYAHAVEIVTLPNGKGVQEIVINNYSGKKQKVRASVFILACCSVQNSRLMLLSNKQQPRGIGNENDLVGRYFMEHAEIKSAELWLKDKTPFKLYLHEKYNMRAELAVTPQQQAELKILNGIMSFVPLYTASKMLPMIKAWSTEDPRANQQRVVDNYNDVKEGRYDHYWKAPKPEAYQIVMRLEQAPNPDSRVTLDPSVKDEMGNPKVKLNWILGEQEKYSTRTIYELLGKEVGKAGIGRVKLLHNLPDAKDPHMPETTSAGWHHMGTTRMAEDPKKGVVDANCKVHGIDNLFIASSSCFPTGGGVNPTMTIVALTLRLTDHIKQKLGS